MSLITLVSLALTVQATPSEPKKWSIALGGDVMLNAVSVKTKSLQSVHSAFSEADIAIVNLEIPLTTSRTATRMKTPKMLKARDQFILKADPSHIGKLSAAGIDGVSLANNHAMDYGFAGVTQMTDLLNRKKIVYAGAGKNESAASSPIRVEGKNGTNIALTSFLAFINDSALDVCTPATSTKPGIAVLRFGGQIDAKARASLKKIVASARKKSSFVAIALHWGIERQTLPTPYQVQLGRAFIDAGADLVIGHHPHVLQGAETYKSKLILYSLGNLISPRPASSAVVVANYDGRTFKSLSVLPITMSNGKVSTLGTKQAEYALENFRNLSQKIQKRYKKEKAQAPSLKLLQLSNTKS